MAVRNSDASISSRHADHRLVIAQAAPPQQTPKREIPDPGAIATGARVTPAGIQSVFDGKVSGVRLARRQTKCGSPSRAASIASTGDATNRARAAVSTGGLASTRSQWIPSESAWSPRSSDACPHHPARRTLADPRSLTSAPSTPTSPATRRAWRFDSGALGDYMAGAPAIAARAGADGKRLTVVPLPANDALAVLDAETGALVRTIPLGVEPIAAVDLRGLAQSRMSPCSADQSRPKGSVHRCSAAMRASEAVRVDRAWHRAARRRESRRSRDGQVTRDDHRRAPSNRARLGRAGRTLYVAAGNSDSIAVIDTKTNAGVEHSRSRRFVSGRSDSRQRRSRCLRIARRSSSRSAA